MIHLVQNSVRKYNNREAIHTKFRVILTFSGRSGTCPDTMGIDTVTDESGTSLAPGIGRNGES